MWSPDSTPAAAATRNEESSPPLVNTPTGTSDISSRSTARSSAARSVAGPSSRDVAQRAVQRRREPLEPPRLVRKGEQRLDLRGEPQLAVHLGPEQRLLARAVAREHEAPAPVVPHRQPEHALEPADRVGTEALVQRYDGLDVSGGAERVALPSALPAELGRIVDLAVAHHPDRAVRALKRLVAGGEIHDGEPARADARALVAHDLLAVRPAVRERSRHRPEAARMTQRATRERDDAENAAHASPLLLSPLLTTRRGADEGGEAGPVRDVAATRREQREGGGKLGAGVAVRRGRHKDRRHRAAGQGLAPVCCREER